MNIFVLDLNPSKAASYHCDRHVTKMILESVQIMNTALYKRGLSDWAFYSKTHENHPCINWAAESWANMDWLMRLTHELNKEYRARYGNGSHTSYQKVADNWYDDGVLLPVKNDERTSFAQAMPDELQQENAVDAYRSYYAQEKATQDWFEYSRTEEPKWLSDFGTK